MAVSIRLSRQGAKKNPQYSVVVVDRTSGRDGAYLQKLGRYLPKEVELKDKIKIDLQALQVWMARGAQMTPTVRQLVKGLLKAS